MNLGLSPLSIGGKKSLPLMKQLEANMLAAVKQAGGAAWYVPDDFLKLGPELITNGDFSNGTTGWAISSGSTLANVGGELEITANGSTSYPGASQVIQTTVGKMYQVTVKSRRGTSASSTGLAISRSGGASNLIAVAINASTTTGQYTTFVTSDWAAWNVLPHASGNPASAGTVYFDDISIREILSAKDFQDNAGTLPSYLSGTVGLLTDRSYNGELGPELVSTWAAQNAATISSTNTLPVACTATVSGDNGVFIAGPPAGKQYAVSVAWSGNDEGRTIQVRVGSAYTSLGSSVSGSATIIAYADNTNNLIVRAASSAVGDTYTITAFSVRELKGAHASQATAGNRPVITRIPRKLGPELFQSVVISGANATNTGSASGNGFTLNQVDTSSIVAATIGLSAVPTAGKSYYITSTPSGLSGNGFKVDNTAWTPAPAQVTAGFTITATGTPSAGIYIYRNTAPAAGTFSNISVREVLEWSYALTFDGSNDSLAAPASVIGAALSNPYTMIAWGRVGAIGASRAMQGDYARWMGVDASGKPVLVHFGATTLRGATVFKQGDLLVLETTFDGTTAKIWANSVKDAEAPAALSTTAAVPHAVGSPGISSSYYNDAIGGAIVCPAVMTDAQRAAVRKFAAAQLGLSL